MLMGNLMKNIKINENICIFFQAMKNHFLINSIFILLILNIGSLTTLNSRLRQYTYME